MVHLADGRSLSFPDSYSRKAAVQTDLTPWQVCSHESFSRAPENTVTLRRVGRDGEDNSPQLFWFLGCLFLTYPPA